MHSEFLLHAPVSLVPVLVFLVLLDRFDDHNLIRYYHIVPTILIGGGLAFAAYHINGFALYELGLDYRAYTRYVAPLLEETLKGAVIVYFFRTNRIGYSTDAAIRGFAIGSGFAVVENLYYLYSAVELSLAVWIIRGFGTAIMHGGATAVFGIMAAQFTDENHKTNPALYLPGLIVAGAIHAIYNHFPGNPALAAFGSTAAITAALAWLFRGDFTNIRQDLTGDLEEHEELYAKIQRDEHFTSPDHTLTADLHTEFEAYLVDDVIQYMHLHTELVITAEKKILAWRDGDTSPIDTGILNQFSELRDLEIMIGKEGIRRALQKMNMSRQELWKLYMLESRANHETLPSDTTGKWGDKTNATRDPDTKGEDNAKTETDPQG